MTIKKCFICLFSLVLCTATYAEDLLSRKFEFKPGQPQTLDNPLWWQVNIKCAITTVDAEDVLSGVVKKKSATLNGQVLKEGDRTAILVKNDDILHIIADSGAKIEITNTGTSVVKAKCST